MLIRDFLPDDCEKLVEILKANQQFGHPELDGPEAMKRVSECDAAEWKQGNNLPGFCTPLLSAEGDRDSFGEGDSKEV